KQLDRTAGDMFKNERDASRKLTDAANGIRDKRIRDKINYSNSMLRGGSQTGDVAAFERDVQNNLNDLKNKIGEAASAVGHSKPDASQQALDKTRALADGMQSMGERMRQGQQGSSGSQSANGSQRSGSQGSQGSQQQNGQQNQQNQNQQNQSQQNQNQG